MTYKIPRPKEKERKVFDEGKDKYKMAVENAEAKDKLEQDSYIDQEEDKYELV